MHRVGGDPGARRPAREFLGEQHVAQLGDPVPVHPGDTALRLAQRLEVDLVRRVVGVAGHRHHPGRRAGGQAAEQVVRQHEVAEVVDPEHQLETLLGQPAGPDHAGVVHQPVQRLTPGQEG